MNIIKITIYIFIVILSIIIINMFINCKINENFEKSGLNTILSSPNGNEINVHYQRDETDSNRNYIKQNNPLGFRCGSESERDNYNFINVNPNRNPIDTNNFNLLFNRIEDDNDVWTKVNIGMKGDDCKTWVKNQNIHRDRTSMLTGIEHGNFQLDLTDALDLCSVNPECMMVSENNGYEYIFNARRLNFNDHIRFAESLGQEEGGWDEEERFNLVSIMSQEEQTIVQETIPDRFKQHNTFIGLRSGSNTWLDRNNRTFTNWMSGEPRRWNGDVVAIRGRTTVQAWQGEWFVHPGRNRLQAVYKRKISNKPYNFEVSPLSDNNLTLDEHQIRAEDRGGNLASITSRYENLLAENALFKSGLSSALIGGQRIPGSRRNDGSARAWRWRYPNNQRPRWRFTSWHPREPNDTEETNVEIVRDWIRKFGGGWNDVGRSVGAAIYKLPNNRYTLWRKNSGHPFSIFNNPIRGVDSNNLYHKVCLDLPGNVEAAGFNDNNLTIQFKDISTSNNPCDNPNGDFNMGTTRFPINDLKQNIFPISNTVDQTTVIRNFVNDRLNSEYMQNNVLGRYPGDSLIKNIRTFFPLLTRIFPSTATPPTPPSTTTVTEFKNNIVNSVVDEISQNVPNILTSKQTNRYIFDEEFKKYIDNLIQKKLNAENLELGHHVDDLKTRLQRRF